MLDRELSCHHRTISDSEILEFQVDLLTWFNKNGRRFPWRNKSISNYQRVISEILLQRTRAETVAGFLGTFVNKYPSWQDLARAEEVKIGNDIRPIGLWNRRAVTLKRLAIEISKRNGRFPREREAIQLLPGVGQYITNAILLVCHGQPEPLLDSNMARVLERVFGPRKLADIRYDPYLQSISRKVVQCKRPKEINWSIIDLAATICLPRKPRCDSCPVPLLCKWNQQRINLKKGKEVDN